MKTFPLKRLSHSEALDMQFRLVDAIHRVFDGHEVVQDGDYGYSLRPELGRPRHTAKVEEVLEKFFDVPRAALVRGGGTSALRTIIMAAIRPAGRVLAHIAPLYPTTKATLDAMGAQIVTADYNDGAAVESALRQDIDLVHIQHARHLLSDRYDLADLIKRTRAASPKAAIMVDDSYAVCRTAAIGAQLGADISGFSFFKLFGPGVGCAVAGTERGITIVDRMRQLNRSGGQRVPGPEAMEVLRGLVHAPVGLANQGLVVEELTRRLNSGECSGVRAAHAANCNSYAVFVELDKPISADVLDVTPGLGAQRQVVGSESRIELTALMHETFHYFEAGADKDIGDRRNHWLRINPHRAGPDTIIRVLSEAIRTVSQARSKAQV